MLKLLIGLTLFGLFFEAIRADCPVCLPLRLGTEEELPSFEKAKGSSALFGIGKFHFLGSKIGCGSIKTMNSSCIAEISCRGTNSAYNSETSLLSMEGNLWGGNAVNGLLTVTKTLKCTSQGWVEYLFPDIIRRQTTYFCLGTQKNRFIQ